MSLFGFFENSVALYPQHTALWVDNQEYSYAALFRKSLHCASYAAGSSKSVVGILASRSLVAYAGILGILQKNRAYVPLNPKFPAHRNLAIAISSGMDMLIVGKECMQEAIELSPLLPDDIKLCFPDCILADIPQEIAERRRIYTATELPSPQNAEPTNLAYILFTSGSSGTPKGVPVKQSSVEDYVHYLLKRYKPTCDDRFSQTFDLTFDLSVHDMFLCWAGSSALHVLPEKSVLGPSKFIREHKLTFWFSVPSVGQFMDRFRMLKPGIFPDLRCSLFCGEPLPLDIAKKWQETTGHQLLENIYGPTEATIGISHYTIPENATDAKSRNGILSIGQVFYTQNKRIVNEQGEDAFAGELWLAGSQVCDGYLNNPEKTASQFEEFNGQRWYKTGDLVEADADGDLYYLGRIDMQVKIRGYRVELDEINHAIQKISGKTMVFSVPYPVNNGIAESIYSFVDSTCTVSKENILTGLNEYLPEYMIPKDIIFAGEFPLNASGKIDKLALIKQLENNEPGHSQTGA